LIGKSAISDLGTSELGAVEITALQTNQNVLRLQAKSLKLNVLVHETQPTNITRSISESLKNSITFVSRHPSEEGIVIPLQNIPF
jgi:hypothetical protein